MTCEPTMINLVGMDLAAVGNDSGNAGEMVDVVQEILVRHVGTGDVEIIDVDRSRRPRKSRRRG